MSTSPSVSLSFIVRVPVIFLVRALVRNSDPAVQAARAKHVMDVSKDIEAALSSGSATDINALTAVLLEDRSGVPVPKGSDPGLADALQTIVVAAVNKVIGLHEAANGSVVDTEVTNLVVAALDCVISVSADYLPQTPSAPPAAAPTQAAA